MGVVKMIKKQQLKKLCEEYDKLQLKYGDKHLNSIYFGGCIDKPNLCLVFMNPTKRNIASFKTWKGIKAPWIGTKNVWSFFKKIGLINDDIYYKIRLLKGKEWTESFSKKVYDNIKENKVFITNLAKCTQKDARELPDSIYEQYLNLFFKEIDIIEPKIIILFGNQVSKIVLKQNISVSKCRQKEFILNKKYKCYSVYYPVGNGYFNIDKAVEDLNKIINNLN